MCTGIMDVQQSVSALPRPPTVQDLHRIVPVIGKNGAVKQCRGGIDVKDILNKFSMSISQFFELSYMATLSPEHRTLNMTDARESCENLRWKEKKHVTLLMIVQTQELNVHVLSESHLPVHVLYTK